MKTSTKQAKNFRPTISKIVMALAFASVMGGMTISSAFGQHNERRDRQARDRGQHDNRNENDNRDRNDRGDQREWRPAYRPVYQEPYYYSQPVYVPPPVYYPPQQSPGISLFFPLDLR